MADELKGERVAFLATDGVEQIELTAPWQAIGNAGAERDLVSPKRDEIQGFDKLDKADRFPVNRPVAEAKVADYQGLVIPGGVANPDFLRLDDDSVRFVKDFFEQSKPVAAICHGLWMLVEADVVRDRTVTSWPSLETDIRNAGGHWVDESVHVDAGLVSSRGPGDLDAFCGKAVEEFAEGRHAGQTV